jgi:hypothetical protein
VVSAPVVYAVKAQNDIGPNIFYISLSISYPKKSPSVVHVAENAANPFTSILVSWTAATSWYDLWHLNEKYLTSYFDI